MASMNPFTLLFSPSGGIDKRTFAIAIIGFYAVGLASHLLLSAPVTVRAGLLPFAVAQGVLTWTWFALHAKRLRDAGRGIGGALAVAIIYGLAVVLLLLVMSAFAGVPSDPANKQGALAGLGGLLVVFFVFALLFDPSKLTILTTILIVLVLIAYLPLLLSLGWSIWTGTRPSASPAP